MLNNKNIIAALIAALSIFVFFALVLPEYDAIKATREILSERREKLAERTALVDQVAALRSQYDKNADNIGKLDVLLPTNKQQDQIVSSIQDIASQAGLVLSEISIADLPNQQSDTAYKSGLVVLRALGSYDQFFNFMSTLEENLRLYDVQAMTISELNNANSGGRQLNFEVKININSIK